MCLGSILFQEAQMKRKPKPSGTDGLNILVLEPHGERQGLGNRNGGLIRQPGNSINLLRRFQGFQVCEELDTISRESGWKGAQHLSHCGVKMNSETESHQCYSESVDLLTFGFCMKTTNSL